MTVAAHGRAGCRITELRDEGRPERRRLLERAFRALGETGVRLYDLASEARLPADLVATTSTQDPGPGR